MNVPIVSSNVREIIAAEHEKLDAYFHRLRTFLSKQPRHLAEMATIFHELAELLHGHFKHEEQGGYFSEVLEVAPHLFEHVEHLRREHQILLETAKQMAFDVECAKDSEAWRMAIRSDLEAFIRRCHEHDTAENRLAQEAWCRDLGLAD